jgi:hypothetical protein
MRPDQSIEVQLLDKSGKRLAVGNVLVDLHLYARGNFRFAFRVGRTDSEGKLTITYADVEAQRRANAEFNLMDYNTKLDDCDPRVEIVVASEKELRDQYENVLRSYKKPPAWAADWPANAQVTGHREPIELSGKVTTAGLSV